MKHCIISIVIYIVFLLLTAYVFGYRCTGCIDQPTVIAFYCLWSIVFLFAYILDCIDASINGSNN